MASEAPAVELPAKRKLTAKQRLQYEQALKEDDLAISRIQADLVERAAEECRALTTAMYKKLPSELIQHVLRYLCIEEQAIPVGPKYHFRRYGETAYRTDGSSNLATALSHGRTSIDHSETPDSNLLMPDSHVFEKHYMGEVGALDALQVYFANNTFSICNVEDGIARFFKRSLWYNMRARPEIRTSSGSIGPTAFKSVRKLQIRIKYEHARDVSLQGVMRLRGEESVRFANECNLLRTSNNALNVLLKLPQAVVRENVLKIEFILMTSLDDRIVPPAFPGDAVSGATQRPFINLLQALRNTFYSLMYDRDQSEIRIIHHDERVSPFPRDITALWSLTKEQWDQEKLANRGRSDWTTGFYLARREVYEPDSQGALAVSETAALLCERWGIENVLRENKPKWPIKTGRYWPVRTRSV